MKDKVVVDWDEEQKKIEEEYKKKLADLKKMRQENEIVDKVLTRGILSTLVLTIIEDEPSNGNEISTKVSEITEGAWQPSTGGIYPILKKHEKAGYIKGEWDDPEKRVKRIYTITEKGKEEVEIQKSLLATSLRRTVDMLNDILKILQ